MNTEAVVAQISTEGSFFSMIYQGGLLSILVFLVLLAMSVLSWAIIIRKWVYLSTLTKSAKRFLNRVDINNELSDMLLLAEQETQTYTARLFKEAYAIFFKNVNLVEDGTNGFNKRQLTQKIERRIEKAIISEKAMIEKELGLLATISSSAPFIGLLGTVTGIIDAFYSIAAQGASSIAVVAPGISAALVATAVGLFTAIPALIAYNIFREKVRALSNKMVGFGLDLLTLFDQSLEDELILQEDKFPEIKLGSK